MSDDARGTRWGSKGRGDGRGVPTFDGVDEAVTVVDDATEALAWRNYPSSVFQRSRMMDGCAWYSSRWTSAAAVRFLRK